MKFYVFDFDVNKKKYYWVILKDLMSVIGLNNSHLVVRGKVYPKKQIEYRRQFGTLFDPFLTHMGPPIIHKSVYELFLEKGLTGWIATPAILHFPKKVLNYDYYTMYITGTVGPIQFEKSQLLKRETQTGMFWPYRLGLFFDENTWDGSDFFMSTDTTGLIIITEKAREVILQSGTKNARITPIEDVELGGSPIK